MSLLVDTSVWSLALRRDGPQDLATVRELQRSLAGPDLVVATGIILQELLQGFIPHTAQVRILERFAYVPLVEPQRDDYIAAAGLRNTCRESGVQLGTVDALIAQLAIRDDHTLLTADRD